MKRIFNTILIILLLSATTLNAQSEGIGVSFLNQVPLSSYFNPGARIPYNGYLGLGFSNFSFSFYNSNLLYDEIFIDNNGTPSGIKADNLVSSLDEYDNMLGTALSIDFINIGFRVNKLFFSIDWRIKASMNFGYSRDFLGFFIRGNGNYMGVGNEANIDFDIDASAYSEVGIGIQYQINDKLIVGIRPKMLFGIANMTTDIANAKVYTDPDSYSMSASVDLNMKVSSVLSNSIYCLGDITKSLDVDSTGIDKLFNFSKNTGYGIDFGATYMINEHFGASLAVLDLGFINWKNARSLDNHKSNLELGAMFTDLDDVLDMGLDYKNILDDVVNNILGNDSLSDTKDYKTYLNTRLMLQAYYEFHPMLRLTGVGQMRFAENKVYPAVTIAYSGEFLRFLNLTLNYTAAKKMSSCIGAGVGLHLGALNIYVVSDNIMTLTNIESSAAKLITDYSTANLRFGLVWSIGKYKRLNEAEKFSKDDVEVEDEKEVKNEDER